MRPIRASEIGAYLYCQRAWWLRRRGHTPSNQTLLAGGHELHERHGRTVIATGCLRSVAYALLLTALILITIVITQQFFL